MAGSLDKCRTSGRSPPIHEFTGSFKGQVVTFRVTSVTGHVFSVDFPAAYQNWESTQPVELFGAPIVRKPTRGSMVKFLKDAGKNVDSLVLWLDCDREGENICFEVIDCVKAGMVKRKGQQIYRAKFSAINPSDIKKAMKSLGEPNKNESMSVDARQELDLKVGVAFSRFQTRFFQGRYGDLDSSCISFGPCQTPTLGFCVTRHLQIKNFCPEDYWVLQTRIVRDGTPLSFEWGRGRVFDQEIGIMFEKIVLKGGVLKYPSEHEETKRGRPTPMNTVEMLKAASKVLGIGPKECIHAAENHCTCKGTCRTLERNQRHILILLTLRAHCSSNRSIATGAIMCANCYMMALNGPKVVLTQATIHQLLHTGWRKRIFTGSMARIYDLVTRHFIASVVRTPPTPDFPIIC